MPKSLINLTNESICEYFLNNKSADAVEIDLEDLKSIEADSLFTNRTIYEDKAMRIVYSYCEVEKGNIYEQFIVCSTWWGKIKNSFFTLKGHKGKCKLRYGVIYRSKLSDHSSGTNHAINNRNSVAQIEVTDFATFTKKCQRVFKDSPSYFVTKVVSLSPNPWVRIQVTMPDGTKHESEGYSQKDAANRFALRYKW